MDRLERTPLKEQSTNTLRSPIRLTTTESKQKLQRSAINRPINNVINQQPKRKNQIKANPVGHHANINESREAEEELQRWREQWRRIMHTSIVFFDAIDQQNIDKVRPHLNSLGTQIQPFFERQVTHLITRRPTTVDYPSTDIITKAKLLDMKVWSYEKLIRFLTHLFGSSPLDRKTIQSNSNSSNNLSKLLKQEKLLGPSDRDFNAPSDNFRLFKGPYLLIWDPTHSFRPTLFKEFPKAPADGEGDWSQFRLTPQGQCPFIYISTKDMIVQERSLEKRKKLLVQQQKAEEEERERQDEIELEINEIEEEEEEEDDDDEDINEEEKDYGSSSCKRSRGDNDGEDEEIYAHQDEDENDDETVDQDEDKSQINQFQSKPQPEPIHTTQLPPRKKLVVEHTSRFYELAASGVNRSNSTSAIKSVAQSGGQSGTSTVSANGLAATVAQVPSRELANLQRKVLNRPSNTSSKMSVIDESREISPTISSNNVSSRMAVPIRPSVATKAEVQAIALAKKKRCSNEPKQKSQIKKKVGYCENCQEQFESFDSHILSKRHRRFANDDKNFQALDLLISQLQRREL